MTKLPIVKVNTCKTEYAELNDKGGLVNAYQPLKNFAKEGTHELTDFTTDKLNFDL
jgi:hypothetical protein